MWRRHVVQRKVPALVRGVKWIPSARKAYRLAMRKVSVWSSREVGVGVGLCRHILALEMLRSSWNWGSVLTMWLCEAGLRGPRVCVRITYRLLMDGMEGVHELLLEMWTGV